METIEKKQAKSRLAKGIDYFTVRFTIFILAGITYNQLGLHFYLSIILAIFTTALINRQVNYFKQKRLTKMARKKSLQELSSKNEEENVSQELEKQVAAKTLKSFNFLLSAIFLFVLGYFFNGWFKYYFYAFTLINVFLAVANLYKNKEIAIPIKDDRN